MNKTKLTPQFIGITLLLVAVLAALLCRYRHPALPPQARQMPTTAEVAIKPISPSTTSIAETDPATISSAIASLCGADSATADRYEARNDALRSISRDRNLPADDVAALVSWLASTNDVLRVERLAALKNDVMNLLRRTHQPALRRNCPLRPCRRRLRHARSGCGTAAAHACALRPVCQCHRPHRGHPACRTARLRRGASAPPRNAFSPAPRRRDGHCLHRLAGASWRRRGLAAAAALRDNGAALRHRRRDGNQENRRTGG